VSPLAADNIAELVTSTSNREIEYICAPSMNNGELDHILMYMGQRLLDNVRAESGKSPGKFSERIIGSVLLLVAGPPRTLQRLMERYSNGSFSSYAEYGSALTAVFLFITCVTLYISYS
jgi:hypothetical protein